MNGYGSHLDVFKKLFSLKKIISFSIWGSTPKYAYSALANLELSKTIYPGWTCRFYVDETVPQEVIKKLSQGAEVVTMPKSDGYFGLFWRFQPFDDPEVERFIVRDTDSRLSLREAEAVKEWEESKKPFHIMRDHEQHNVAPIPGGMWGATNKLKINFKEKLDKWLQNNSHRFYVNLIGKYFFLDQSFLRECIWPLIINKHIAHESVSSEWPGLKKNFSIENPDGTFIGQSI